MYTTNNSGAGGATKIFTSSSFTDSVGNTWTRRLDALYDPGLAGAGVEIAAYTSPIVTQITTSDNITVTLSTSTGARSAIVWEVSGANGAPTYVASAAVSDGLTSGQTGTAVSVTSSSITNGDVIIGWNGSRDNTSITADSDTVNGSWATAVQISQTPRFSTQYKITTGTGTQSWDITTGGSAAWECGWIQLREAAAGAQSATQGFLAW